LSLRSNLLTGNLFITCQTCGYLNRLLGGSKSTQTLKSIFVSGRTLLAQAVRGVWTNRPHASEGPGGRGRCRTLQNKFSRHNLCSSLQVSMTVLCSLNPHRCCIHCARSVRLTVPRLACSCGLVPRLFSPGNFRAALCLQVRSLIRSVWSSS